VLFESRLRNGLLDGSITVAFRRWRRPQVVAGHRYRLGFGAGMIGVESVGRVDAASLTEADARAAGFGSLADLLRETSRTAAGDLYRIGFGALGDDPRDALRERVDEDDFVDLDRRLARIADERPLATLHLIAEQPAVRAAELKDVLGWTELAPFKLHVRKLKALGLTISLERGYRLSPRGEAYVRARPLPAGESSGGG
jgi:hypothetical protein